jgi:CBS domain-containing protein
MPESSQLFSGITTIINGTIRDWQIMNAANRIRDHMATELVTVTPDTEIMRAVHLLVQHDISGMPVIEVNGRLVGILTERNCIDVALQAGYFDESGGRVADYMSSPVETVGPDDSLMDVADRFRQSSFRRFPVVEDGRLIGLISRRDVLTALRSGAWFSKP